MMQVRNAIVGLYFRYASSLVSLNYCRDSVVGLIARSHGMMTMMVWDSGEDKNHLYVTRMSDHDGEETRGKRDQRGLLRITEIPVWDVFIGSTKVFRVYQMDNYLRMRMREFE